MRPILLWAKQPTTLLAFALVAAAIAYWFTRSAALAATVAAAILGGVNDQTRDLIAGVEAMEDAIHSVTKVNATSAIVQSSNAPRTEITSVKPAT